MKLYEITIRPQAGFGTTLKGDTLFGHFCWQVQHDPKLLNGGLDRWIALYEDRPFAVFSSAWPSLKMDGKNCYALKRPDLPLSRLFPQTEGDRKKRMAERKQKAKQNWLLVTKDLRIDLKTAAYRSEQQIAALVLEESAETTRRLMRGREKLSLTADFLQPHNTINRWTQTTGVGLFAPYSLPSVFFYPGMELAVFVLLDEEATDIARVRFALERIGSHGFGRDASTGLGRFTLGREAEIYLPAIPKANACYTLAPAVPEKGAFRNCFFKPFTRFGRHGDALATSENPFKNPIIMADEGAVFVPADQTAFNNPYLGRAVRDLSKSEPRTVAQGYAPYLPLTLEMET